MHICKWALSCTGKPSTLLFAACPLIDVLKFHGKCGLKTLCHSTDHYGSWLRFISFIAFILYHLYIKNGSTVSIEKWNQTVNQLMKPSSNQTVNPLFLSFSAKLPYRVEMIWSWWKCLQQRCLLRTIKHMNFCFGEDGVDIFSLLLPLSATKTMDIKYKDTERWREGRATREIRT